MSARMTGVPGEAYIPTSRSLVTGHMQALLHLLPDSLVTP